MSSALKQRYPTAELDVVAPAWTLSLLERMPEVDNPVALDAGHGELVLGKRLALGERLEARDRDYRTPLCVIRCVGLAASLGGAWGGRSSHGYQILPDHRESLRMSRIPSPGRYRSGNIILWQRGGIVNDRRRACGRVVPINFNYH